MIDRRVEVKDSSNIIGVAFRGDEFGYNRLIVKFDSGHVYEYDKVTINTFGDLVSALSVGTFFHRNIKGKYPERKLR